MIPRRGCADLFHHNGINCLLIYCSFLMVCLLLDAMLNNRYNALSTGNRHGL